MHTLAIRPRITSGHAASVVRDLALAFGARTALASAIVQPVRFAVVSPYCQAWGESDWFLPYVDPVAPDLDLYKRKADGAVYARYELAPSLPLWQSAERLACVRSDVDACSLSVQSDPLDRASRAQVAFEESYQARRLP